MSGRNLVFEIGCEELPSNAIYNALDQLKVSATKALDEARLEYDEIDVVATPRRLAILVTDLAESQPDAVERIKGPAAKAAFDADGNPTQAAIGFARGKGVDVSVLEVSDEDGGSYVYATREISGLPTVEVLPGLLGRLVSGIEWAKSQRWGSGDTRFSRPVRWLLALYGPEVVPVEFAGLVAGRITRGHRFLAPGPFECAEAGDWPVVLEQAFVMVDEKKRAGVLREGIERAAAAHGGKAVVPEKTFAEVINLVEWPTVGVGEFDAGFLTVPREMLENAMTSHQRYFPVERADGNLDNRFIVAHNGDPERTASIISGHQRVIRARLSDAAFFYKEDLALTLEEWLPKLDNVVFQEKLGTVAQKIGRIERLAEFLVPMLDAPADEAAYAHRAAHLAKADLVTNAVVEFTDLQGVMGHYYADAAGEKPQVGVAIEEHYRPRFAGDALPSTTAGTMVSVADKMDTIAGIFAAGMAPKGSADPFGLRRAAIGILQIALDGRPIQLDPLIGSALEGYGDLLGDEEFKVAAGAIKAFFVARLQGLLKDRGFAHDTIEAVLHVSSSEPADVLARCEALATAREEAPDAFEDLSIAFKRAANLVGETRNAIDPALLGAEEKALFDALNESESRVQSLLSQRAYSALLQTYAAMREPIDSFFENVLVMDEDLTLRANRLGLLGRFVEQFKLFADFSALGG